jgi:hypothetical protein
MLLALMLSLSISSDAKLSSEPCEATDLVCVHRALQQQAIEIESLGRQLNIRAEQARTAEELVRVWRDQAALARDAMKEAMAAIKTAPWWHHPALWVSVGFAVATILTVTIAYSLRAVYQVLP